MRTKKEIKQTIISAFMNNDQMAEAYGFNAGADFKETFSLVSLENIWFELVAFILFIQEQIFDHHKKEVDQALRERIPHTLRWYRNKAKDFQHGFALLEDSDQFDNADHSDDEIEESKIVKYAAVIENETERRLIIKIATEIDGELQPISAQQEESFQAYMAEIKDAGVPITVVNYLPDNLHLQMRIFRNPMVLDENGTHILNGGKPVEEAIQNYLRQLPFNGELILQELANAIEVADGVEIVQLDNAQTSWTPEGEGNGQVNNIDVSAVPVSGYFSIDNYNDISYVVRN